MQKVEDAAREKIYRREEKKGGREREREKGGKDNRVSRAITVQFVQLTFIMSPSGGADRSGENDRAYIKCLTPIIQSDHDAHPRLLSSVFFLLYRNNFIEIHADFAIIHARCDPDAQSADRGSDLPRMRIRSVWKMEINRALFHYILLSVSSVARLQRYRRFWKNPILVLSSMNSVVF